MTAIDRTAYPRPGEKLTREELDNRYSVSETDHAFIRATARTDAGRLTLATLLKARQDLGCFPAPLEIHIDTVAHLASQLALAAVPPAISPADLMNERRSMNSSPGARRAQATAEAGQTPNVKNRHCRASAWRCLTYSDLAASLVPGPFFG